MNMKQFLFRAVLPAGLVSVVSLQAGLIFTIEGPGVQATSVSGVTTETFDTAALGSFSGAISIGTLSSGGAIVAPDAFGGSDATRYYAVGVQSGSTEATLTLNEAQNYFGMWWPAGDAGNKLEFYNGASLLGSYRVGDIIPLLSPGYFGNPNNGLNGGEAYVYLNFTATGTDSITSVKFLNDTIFSGFEIDNLSVTTERIDPPGTLPGVPDAGSTAGLLALALVMIRSIKSRSSAESRK